MRTCLWKRQEHDSGHLIWCLHARSATDITTMLDPCESGTRGCYLIAASWFRRWSPYGACPCLQIWIHVWPRRYSCRRYFCGYACMLDSLPSLILPPEFWRWLPCWSSRTFLCFSSHHSLYGISYHTSDWRSGKNFLRYSGLLLMRIR
jgi:hypothetical protein